jgi:hypothetical protein
MDLVQAAPLYTGSAAHIAEVYFMEKLREEFAQAVREAIKNCHEFGYHPVRWEKMINEQHPVDVAIYFIVSGEFQDGFKHLVREGKEDLTMESLMLQPRFAPLFTSDVLNVAIWRLRTVTAEF